MEKPSIEMVLRYIHTFYGNDTTMEQRKAANNWLIQLQESVYAWDVAHQLLTSSMESTHHLFGAQTIQTKIRHYFDELPLEMHIPVRDSIMNHCERLCSTAGWPVINQLCLALADLALQMDNWDTVVQDCINRYGTQYKHVLILLSILMVLPEEIGNRYLKLGENRRTKWRQLFEQQCSGILQLLSSCLSYWGEDGEIQIRVFECLGSWITLKTFSPDELANSSLMLAPFKTLYPAKVPEKLHEVASDCICSALFICDDVSSFAPLATFLQNQVNQLSPLFIASLDIEEPDRANSLARIFTEMAESFLFYIVHYPDTSHGSMHTLDLLLMCADHYDYEIIDMTLSVWYRLAEMLVKIQDQETNLRFKPYIARLTSSLIKHCQLNEDLGKNELPDETEEFHEFRMGAVDVVSDHAFVIGPIECFQELYKMLCTPGQAWQVMESCLLLMKAVASKISKEESNLLPIAIPVLLSFPPNDTHYAIRATTLELIGELAHWIGNHPDLIPDTLRFIQEAFNVPVLASAAASAVQSLCVNCKGQLIHLFDGLVSIIDAADNLNMSNNAIVGLMTGSIQLLDGLPADQISSGMNRLCIPPGQRLNQILQQNGVIKSNTLSDPALWMDRIAAVFRTCEYIVKENESHPGLPTATQLWPVLCNTLDKYRSDQRIVERTSRCFRFILRCLRSHAAPLITPLVNLCIEIYLQYHHSCFLYLGSIIADEFGSDTSCQSGLVSMVEGFLRVTLPLLSEPAGLDVYPDTVDDMFRLCARMVQRCPLAFFSSPVAMTAVECAKPASLLTHREAFSSVMKFYRDLIHSPFDTSTDCDKTPILNAVNQILTHNGQIIINNLVQGFVTVHSYMLAESAPVLWELLSKYKEPTMRWLEVALDNIRAKKSSHKMTDLQRQNFIQSVQKAESIEDIEDCTRELARLYK